MNRRTLLFAALVLVLTLGLSSGIVAAPAGTEAALKASEISSKIFPDQVFFRGQVAPIQMRNTGGIRFSDDVYVLAGLIDSSGYSSNLREKYQVYLITEVTLEISGQKLSPGAYGVGFLKDNKFVAMDLGGHDLFQVASTKDSEMKRPVPLQIVGSGGKYRLYVGRDYVDMARGQ